MRILQVAPSLSKGGAERVVVEISNAAVQDGNQVDMLLAIRVDPELNEKKLDKRVAIQFLMSNSRSRFLKYIKVFKWLFTNWKRLETYDVIHCHLSFGLIFGLLISLIRKCSNNPSGLIVATCHDVGINVGGMRRIFNQLASRSFDQFVLIGESEDWRKYIEKQQRNEITVIYNGISDEFEAYNEEFDQNKANWFIGTISRLEFERSPWIFLEIYEELEKLLPGKFKYILAGDGSLRKNLESKANSGVIAGKVEFPGLVQKPETVLRKLDIYISLNIENMTGIAGLEAIFFGLPVIGIQVSKTFVGKESDWIWSSSNAREIALKVIHSLSNPEVLKDIRKSQLKYAIHNFSVKIMYKKYRELYDKRSKS